MNWEGHRVLKACQSVRKDWYLFYLLYCIPLRMAYVGVTTSTLENRLNWHIYQRANGGPGTVGEAFRIHEYNENTWVCIKLGRFQMTRAQASAVEKSLIKKHGTRFPRGMNKNQGGGGYVPRAHRNFRVHGRRFESVRHLAEHFKLSTQRVYARLRDGWSLEDAVAPGRRSRVGQGRFTSHLGQQSLPRNATRVAR